jgi:hypothetical protein
MDIPNSLQNNTESGKDLSLLSADLSNHKMEINHNQQTHTNHVQNNLNHSLSSLLLQDNNKPLNQFFDILSKY